jgi:hypothetical protein
LREEEKEVDHRNTNAKDSILRGSKKAALKGKSDAEKNAESLDIDFNVSKVPAMYCFAM